MTVEQIARVTHEAIRAYNSTIGDNTHEPWVHSPPWQRDSALKGVEDIVNGSILTVEQAHEGWIKHKLKEGWRHGPTRDGGLKEHPDMVPYNELKPEHRRKDELFFAIVRACMDPEQRAATDRELHRVAIPTGSEHLAHDVDYATRNIPDSRIPDDDEPVEKTKDNPEGKTQNQLNREKEARENVPRKQADQNLSDRNRAAEDEATDAPRGARKPPVR
jgi:hypothetical protein